MLDRQSPPYASAAADLKSNPFGLETITNIASELKPRQFDSKTATHLYSLSTKSDLEKWLSKPGSCATH
eukprot:223503-Pyramimonas_sp.AAC.1